MQKKISLMIIVCLLWMSPLTVKAYEELSVRKQYEAYMSRFESIERFEDVEKNNYDVIEEQSFPAVFESFGEQEVTFFTAMEENYNRLAVFLMDAEGKILYKTNHLETNNRIIGEMKQPTKEIAAVSFIDVNHDNLKDIILITRCVNDRGEYKGLQYKVGDVLFQAEGVFYRDYRISEKINRFGMNKSARCIISFVRDGKSTEFLYTATTSQELLDNGLNIIEEQCYPRTFEKLGKLQVVPGTFSMGDYEVFMIYLINEQGNIVWSFQPMEDYDNLYSLKGIGCKDLDGDGMKDLVVLARYSYETPNGELAVECNCSIYYQRTGGFDEDREFSKQFQCTNEHKLADIVQEIRKYWGWNTPEETTTEILTETEQKIK